MRAINFEKILLVNWCWRPAAQHVTVLMK